MMSSAKFIYLAWVLAFAAPGVVFAQSPTGGRLRGGRQSRCHTAPGPTCHRDRFDPRPISMRHRRFICIRLSNPYMT